MIYSVPYIYSDSGARCDTYDIFITTVVQLLLAVPHAGVLSFQCSANRTTMLPSIAVDSPTER